jgi:hypothetical protein
MKTFAVILTVCIILTGSTAYAHHEDQHTARGMDGNRAASDVVVDVLITRPIGFVGLVAGTVAFIATLPAALATQSIERSRYAFIEVPFSYTFHRPLGDVRGETKY